MRAEPAPRCGALLVAWIVLVGLMAFTCAPVILALAVIWSARPW